MKIGELIEQLQEYQRFDEDAEVRFVSGGAHTMFEYQIDQVISDTNAGVDTDKEELPEFPGDLPKRRERVIFLIEGTQICYFRGKKDYL
jgi:hypothetical protein